VIGSFPWEPFPPGEPDPKGPDPVHAIAYRAAVTAADAYHAVRLALRRDSGTLRVGNRFVADGRYREVAFLALGNAANSMALAALHAVGNRLTQGFLAGAEPVPPEIPFHGVVVPPGWPGAPEAAAVVDAAHEIARDLTEQDLLLVLLSPGALRALAVPPNGVAPEQFAELLATAFARGATGREIGLLARVLGTGGVGGRLARFAPRADVATLVVERGDGSTVLGGGPMREVAPNERVEARGVADRCGITGTLRPSAWSASEEALPSGRGALARPVVVASPSDALRAAADAVFDKGWSSRLAALEVREPAEPAAAAILGRGEEVLVAERMTAESRTKGVAAFAMTTLGLPEGVDEGPALGRFLTTARAALRRRESSVGLFRTAGDVGSREFPPGAVVGAPTDTEAVVPPDRARAVRMGRGITDVGCLSVVLYPRPGSLTPTRAP
jgi:glycerate-2-kinase